MTTAWYKRWFAWFLVARRPQCEVCGRLLEVGKLFDAGRTQFYCVDEEDLDHVRQDELRKVWWSKIQALQAEFEEGDAALPLNYARQRYGKPVVEVRRKRG